MIDYGKKRKSGGGWAAIANDTGTYTDVDNPYLELAGAILKQAKRDYIMAIMLNNFRRMKHLEDFFLSEWGQLLSFRQGEYIIKRSKEIAIEIMNKPPRKNASRRHIIK